MSNKMILFKDGPPEDWHAASRILEAASDTIVRADATKALKYGGGIINIPLMAAEAEYVASTLTKGGFPAVTFECDKLIRMPRSFKLSSAAALPDAFHMQVDLAGTMDHLAWDSICLVSVVHVQLTGAIENTSEFKATINDLSAISPGVAFSNFNAEKRALTAQEVWLELYSLQPLLRLKIQMRAFNYEYLGERLMTSSKKNFQLMVRDVAMFASKAEQMGQVTETITGKPIESQRNLVEEAAYNQRVSAALTRISLLS